MSPVLAPARVGWVNRPGSQNEGGPYPVWNAAGDPTIDPNKNAVVPRVYGRARVKPVILYVNWAGRGEGTESLNNGGAIYGTLFDAVLAFGQAGATLAGVWKSSDFAGYQLNSSGAWQWTGAELYSALRSLTGHTLIAQQTQGGSTYNSYPTVELLTAAAGPAWGKRFGGTVLTYRGNDTPSPTWAVTDITGSGNAPPAWSALTGAAVGMAFGGVSHVRFPQLSCVETADLFPDIQFLVDGVGGGPNCSPDAAIRDVLVNLIGLPADSIITNQGPDGAYSSSALAYWTGLGGTLSLNRAVTGDASAALAELLQAANCELVFSGGYCKVLPLGDSPIASAYTPCASAYSIGPSDLFGDSGVKVEITEDGETYNAVPVRYKDAAKNFDDAIYTYRDDFDSAQRGRITAGDVDNKWITTAAHASWLSQALVYNSLRNRRTLSFRLSPRYQLLEPGDLLSVNDGLGGPTIVCRVTDLEEGADFSLDIKASEWSGATTPKDLTPEVPSPAPTFPPPSMYGSPSKASSDNAAAITSINYTLLDPVTGLPATNQIATGTQSKVNDPTTGLAATNGIATSAQATARQAASDAAAASQAVTTRAAKDLSDAAANSVAARLIPPSLLGGGNVLRNSSFSSPETNASLYNHGPVPAGWDEYNGGTEACTYSVPTSGGVDGGGYARCDWTVANTGTRGWRTASSYTVNGQAGGIVGGWRKDQWYTVTMWAHSFGSAISGGAMQLCWNIGPTDTVTVSAPALANSWQRYVFRIRWAGNSPEPNGQMFLSCTNRGTAGSLGLDQVQVEEGEVATAYAPRATELVTDSVKAGMVSAGAIGAREIAADSAIFQKVMVGDLTNLCANPSGDGSATGWTGATAVQSGVWAEGGPALRQTGQMATFGPRFQVTPGDQFWVECDAVPEEPTPGSLQIGLAFSDTLTGGYVDGVVLAQTAVAGGGVQHLSGVVTLSDSRAKYAVPYTWKGSASTGAWYYRRVQVRRMAAGNLIVDGAITATKLAAKAVTAQHLAIGDWENLCTNPSGDNGLAGWTLGVTSYGASGAWPGFNELVQTNRDGLFGTPFAVTPGDQFYVSCDVFTQGGWTLGDFSLGLCFYQNSTSVAQGTQANWVAGFTASKSGGIQHVEGRVTVPSGVAFGQIWTCIDATRGATGSAAFRNVQVRRMNGGKLIVDGELTASKMRTDALETSNYSEKCPLDGVTLIKAADGTRYCPTAGHGTRTDGIPIAGGKLASAGTALKVAAGSFQCGMVAAFACQANNSGVITIAEQVGISSVAYTSITVPWGGGSVPLQALRITFAAALPSAARYIVQPITWTSGGGSWSGWQWQTWAADTTGCTIFPFDLYNRTPTSANPGSAQPYGVRVGIIPLW